MMGMSASIGAATRMRSCWWMRAGGCTGVGGRRYAPRGAHLSDDDPGADRCGPRAPGGGVGNPARATGRCGDRARVCGVCSQPEATRSVSRSLHARRCQGRSTRCARDRGRVTHGSLALSSHPPGRSATLACANMRTSSTSSSASTADWPTSCGRNSPAWPRSG